MNVAPASLAAVILASAAFRWAPEAATRASAPEAHSARSVATALNHVDLGFSLDFQGVGAEGVDEIWRGQLAGSPGGEVTVRVEHRAPAIESARAVWPVHALLFVASDDPARSFAAELDGTLDWRSGAMRLSGAVTDGWMKGSPIGQTAQIDPKQLDGTGTLRIDGAGNIGVASTIR